MVDVIAYYIHGHGRSLAISNAFAKGARACGDNVQIQRSRNYRRPDGDIAVFYGFVPPLPQIMQDYREAGKQAVFVDLGYWGRSGGFHKVTVNSRNPDAYFMRRDLGHDRLKRFGIAVHPWRQGGSHILIAGMSAKAARSWGYQPEQWERDAIAELRQHTDRRIVYRPKPSWVDARPIHGVGFSSSSQSLEVALRDCHALVTRHSNAAVDALIAGVPVFCAEGPAAVMGSPDLSRIESPIQPEERAQWLANLAWCQWTMGEIQNGAAWRHMRNEGLIAA